MAKEIRIALIRAGSIVCEYAAATGALGGEVSLVAVAGHSPEKGKFTGEYVRDTGVVQQ